MTAQLASPRRQLSQACFDMIEGHEARRSKTYLDIAGVPTAGVGHTGKDVVMGKTYSDAQINAWLRSDAERALALVYEFVPAAVIDQIPQASLEALVSFLFNVGRQAFRAPGTGKVTNFAKALVAGKFDEVDDRMQDWDKATVNGVLRKVAGLTVRRAAESSLWNLGFHHFERGLPPPVPAMPSLVVPEETSTVPVAPEKSALVPIKTVVGAVASAAGAVTAIAPDLLTETGKNMRTLVGDIPLFNTIGAFIIALGLALIVWQAIQRHQKSGA